MSRRTLSIIVLLVLALTSSAWLILYRYSPHPQQPAAPSSITSIPKMTAAEEQQAVAEVLALNLPDLAGQQQSFAQWRGKILVVNYWASWCAPCVEEMPAFSRLQERYAAQGVQFVGVGIDDPNNMLTFVKKTPVSYPLLVAELGLGQQAGQQVKGLPYTLIIGREGTLVGSRLGRFDEAALEKVLRQALNK
ncbi:MAG TPA: TlpA disulfide reductase family protein [Accumulibacter sp.]|nr:TlpA disulfide reductase family protein [Accumulibacter sp.]HMW17609.1 TlpA disulfide reductase family protein [Accumulibacter sp.]HMX21569.1 TlpA disulfide reductase family protein [Accumulibacter sp.]HMY07615.1 TlpA disulfide reductase family protein [Accumulibacter sp.]HNC17297.1 TlpA disulfide reductase family protein [Accumulibacter sp.]